jgi:hypothetical protein
MELCPFVYGRALQPKEFYNRNRELRRLSTRLATGQSTALIGQPHIGKTSLLYYLLDHRSRQTIGDRLDQSIFSYINSQMLGANFDQSAFWKQVLSPLNNTQFSTGPIDNLYKTAEDQQFDPLTLEHLFCSLGERGWQFILCIDEFDALLSHPILNTPEFYGSLRSFASCSSGGFALVIASRHSLDFLHQETKKINPYGSPYFNILTAIRLGALPKGYAKAIIDQAGKHFKPKDREFILQVSGRHPYLLQSAAAILWELNNQERQDANRYREASDELYTQTHNHFVDTWNSWSIAERKAITAIALAQINGMVDRYTFAWKNLIENITDYSVELRLLKDTGIIIDAGKDTWQITQQAFLWWLADEIKRIARDASSFKNWLCDQEMDCLFTKKERRRMSQAAKKVSGFIGKGATTLIESFAKGLGADGVKAFLS